MVELRERVARQREAGAYADDLSDHQLEARPAIAFRPQMGYVSGSPLGRVAGAARRVLFRLVGYALEDLAGQASRSLEQLDRQIDELVQAQGRIERAVTAIELASEVVTQATRNHLDALRDDVDTLREPFRPIPLPTELLLTNHAGADAIGRRADRSSTVGDGYRGFENVFRGDEELIRERQRVYLDLIGDRTPVLDVGCGRGEFLDLARENGLEATGVDADVGMVGRCREKGHAVELADAVEYLGRLRPGSLGAVVCSHVVEHLDYDYLVRFLALVSERLQQGGVLIAETVNPECIVALRYFWLDPTHRGPVYPQAAVMLSTLHGFDEAIVVYPRGSGDLERDRYEQADYAVLATKSRVDAAASRSIGVAGGRERPT